MNAHRRSTRTHPNLPPILAVTAVVLLAVLAGVTGVAVGTSSEPAAAPQASHAQTRTVGAPTALKRLHIAPIADTHTYVRSAFGSGWADLNHNRCNTREEVMARDLTGITRVDGCNVVKGTLSDPYTGRSIEYREAHANAVQIDHLYPLKKAWLAGAQEWTREKRVAFANDPRNLLAVDGPANESKGDSGPGEWMPLNRAFRCTYARDFTQVAYTYRLPITGADYDALALALNSCKEKRA